MFASWPVRRSSHTANMVARWSLPLAALLLLPAGSPLSPAGPAFALAGGWSTDRLAGGRSAGGLADAVREPCDAGYRPPPVIADEPWPQRDWAASGPAAMGDGAKIVVAVVDSGVDDDHPQLKGAVDAGLDLLGPATANQGTANQGTDGRRDCVGHGTAVASIIAARTVAGSGPRGVAPAARILPIRVTEQRGGDPAGGREVDAGTIAKAIRRAVHDRAKVINLSLAVYRDRPELREAVSEALAADVVVVAAVGNQFPDGNPTPYPAAYPGVLGVGAIDADGHRHPESQVGTFVDIVAAGVGVVGAAPGGGHQADLAGTSFAAPFVAGTAALIRAADPGLSQAQVVQRILATADPLPGPPSEYGAGALNPVRAVTEFVPAVRPSASKRAPVAGPPAARPAEAGSPGPALAWGLGLLAAAGTVTAVAISVPSARRRRWRPGRRTEPARPH